MGSLSVLPYKKEHLDFAKSNVTIFIILSHPGGDEGRKRGLMKNISNIYNKLYDEFLVLVNGNEEMMGATISSSRMGCDVVAHKIESVLGVDMLEITYDWKNNLLSDFTFNSFRIGITTISITNNKCLLGLIHEIIAAIQDGLDVKCSIYSSISCLCNDGMGNCYEFNDENINSMSIRELIKLVNEDQYCDCDFFEEIISKLGYEICEGEHPELGLCKYIDTSKYSNGSKIWLYVGVNQHTLYRDVKPRLIIEILDLLNSLHFGENIFSDEY